MYSKPTRNVPASTWPWDINNSWQPSRDVATAGGEPLLADLAAPMAQPA